MKQEEKIENIIEAATRRFAHFGVDKTTMNEIADDLGFSKASLYYYFPDKLNLYATVLRKIIDAEQANEVPFINEEDLTRAMYKYLEKRTAFINRNYRILEYIKNIGAHIPGEMKELFDQAKHHDIQVIAAFLKKGASEGTLRIPNLKRTTELMHDCLTGLRISLLHNGTQFFPEKEQFDELLTREKELVDIFITALKAK